MFCRLFKHFIIFISYIDTHIIFQGKYESMLQFYIWGVSFVAKYIYNYISEHSICTHQRERCILAIPTKCRWIMKQTRQQLTSVIFNKLTQGMERITINILQYIGPGLTSSLQGSVNVHPVVLYCCCHGDSASVLSYILH